VVIAANGKGGYWTDAFVTASQLRYKASRHGARYIEVDETGSSASLPMLYKPLVA
jgi:hypothetical protein